ncbi:MAG TPA: O-antigen ligase family protein [Nevskiaceae bacterium]|nr:O-antigen ligase family protein [Nevskiaceae bacterium]
MDATAPAPGVGPMRRGWSSHWRIDSRTYRVMTALTWLLIILMTVPDNLDYASLNTSYAPSEGSDLSRVLWIILLTGPLLIIAWRRTLASLLLRWINPFLLVFMVMAIASLAWSDYPDVTARRLIRVLAVMLNALAFVLLGWHGRRFQHAVRPALTAMLIGSIVFGLLRPDLAIHQETSPELLNAWRGLTNHKNTLGDAASLGFVLWLHAWLTRDGNRLLSLCGCAAAGACLVLSRSSTAMMATIAVSAVMPALLWVPQSWRRWVKPGIVASLGLLVTYSVVVLGLIPGLGVLLKPITHLTGKDMTFSGRTEIWAIIVKHIHLHPWLGTGYGGYWIGPYPWAPVYEFLLKLHFYPGSAHNGYLEIVNDLGAVGLVALLGYLCLLLRDSLRLLSFNNAQGVLLIGLFFQQAIANLSETHWWSVLSLDFTLMTLATTSLARALLDERLYRYFGNPYAQAAETAAAERIEVTVHDVQPGFA